MGKECLALVDGKELVQPQRSWMGAEGSLAQPCEEQDCGLTLCCAICFQLAPTGSASLIKSMEVIQNPVEVCDQVFALIESLTCQIQKHLEDPKFAGWEKNSGAACVHAHIMGLPRLDSFSLLWVCWFLPDHD